MDHQKRILLKEREVNIVELRVATIGYCQTSESKNSKFITIHLAKCLINLEIKVKMVFRLITVNICKRPKQ